MNILLASFFAGSAQAATVAAEPGGDLVLSEALAVDDSSIELDEPATVQWLQANPVAHGWEPESCTTVCGTAGLQCDEAALQSAGLTRQSGCKAPQS